VRSSAINSPAQGLLVCTAPPNENIEEPQFFFSTDYFENNKKSYSPVAVARVFLNGFSQTQSCKTAIFMTRI